MAVAIPLFQFKMLSSPFRVCPPLPTVMLYCVPLTIDAPLVIDNTPPPPPPPPIHVVDPSSGSSLWDCDAPPPATTKADNGMGEE
jgi:hypothetical protein